MSHVAETPSASQYSYKYQVGGQAPPHTPSDRFAGVFSHVPPDADIDADAEADDAETDIDTATKMILILILILIMILI